METGPNLKQKMRVIRTPKPSLWWMGELLWSLSVHRINLRYRETLFGFGWIFLQPVALTVIFNYIQKVAKISTGNTPYTLFAATGLVFWSLTSLAISQTTVTLAGEGALLKRIALPKALLPMSTIVASLVDLCVMGGFLVIFFLYYKIALSWAALWIFALLVIHLALLIGIGFLSSLANVYFRDIGHAVPSLMQLWFFASPVFYPASMVPEEFALLSQWNPMTGLLEGYRSALLLGEAPAWEQLIPSAIVSFAILGIGTLVFRRLERNLSDVL